MLGFLVAVLMAGSFFLPWVEIFGNEIGPMMLFDDAAPPLGDLPWRAWAFLASFVLAALAALLAIAQQRAGLVMVIAGAIPFALIAERVLGVREQVEDLGLPMPRADNPQQFFDLVQDFMALGLPAYIISAALMVLIGLGRIIRGR